MGGEDGARLIALVCGSKPDEHTRWSLRLLADTWKTLAYTDVKTVSHETIRRTQKNEIKPWQSQEWCIPPKETEEFVAAMEDILDVYTRKHDKKYPLARADEFPSQLTGEVRTPFPAEPGKPARFDTEYRRNGVCEVFMFVAPLEGWRRAEVTEQRTKTDWAHQIKKLVAVDFPDAEKIVLAHDNLNTHTIGSLYKAFPPEEARQLRDKPEIHYTPKHGGWLNMTEIEIYVLVNHGLSKRVSSIQQMRKKARNKTASKINWRFTTDDARIKLNRLYLLF